MEASNQPKFERKVLKVDDNSKREIDRFEFKSLNKPASNVYTTPVLKGGSLPKSDITEIADHEIVVSPDKKESRFKIDPIIKDLLTYDEREENEIKVRVENEIDRIRTQVEAEARDKGYQEGFEQGKQEAKTEFEKNAKSEYEKIIQFVTSVESLKSEIYSSQERFLLEVIFHVTQNIIHKELSKDSDYVPRLIRDVIEKVGSREQVKIWVNSAQIEKAKALVPDLEKKFTELKSISVETNPQLEEFDAVIETDWNRVDASLKTQLETMHHILQDAVTAADDVCVIPTKKSDNE